MKEVLKNILFEIIYKQLNLSLIEESFIQRNVPSKEIINPDNIEYISKYFFLKNDVYLERLTEEEITNLKLYLEYYKSNDSSLNEKLYKFLDENKLRLLLPETEERYLYWGPTSFEYMAPSDAIVIAFHTIEYTDEDQNIKFERDMFVTDQLNYIQTELAKNNNLKVAVIKYNEVPINNLRII